MQHYEEHASVGHGSFQVMGYKHCRMYGKKKNCFSVQNELLTGHFPCGVVERMI